MQNSEVKKGILIMRDRPATFPIDWSNYVVSRIEDDGTNWYERNTGVSCDGNQCSHEKVGILVQAMVLKDGKWVKDPVWTKPVVFSKIDNYITIEEFKRRCQFVREAQEKPSVDPASIVAKFLELGFRVYLEGDSVRFTHRSEIERLLERVTPCP